MFSLGNLVFGRHLLGRTDRRFGFLHQTGFQSGAPGSIHCWRQPTDFQSGACYQPRRWFSLPLHQRLGWSWRLILFYQLSLIWQLDLCLARRIYVRGFSKVGEETFIDFIAVPSSVMRQKKCFSLP